MSKTSPNIRQVITPTTDQLLSNPLRIIFGPSLSTMIWQFIYRFGSNAKRSLGWFLSGLLLFAVAGGFIAIGYYYQHWWQIIGLMLAIPALLCTLYGYLGILANRLAQIIRRLRADD